MVTHANSTSTTLTINCARLFAICSGFAPIQIIGRVDNATTSRKHRRSSASGLFDDSRADGACAATISCTTNDFDVAIHREVLRVEHKTDFPAALRR
jgi:hypothetical protein